MQRVVKVLDDAEGSQPIDFGEGVLELAENDQEVEAADRAPLAAHVFCAIGLILCIYVLSILGLAIWGQ